MVRITIVMNCGTGTYETDTFEDKKAFERAMRSVQIGNETVITFTDKLKRFISVSPTNCIIECTELKR